MTALEDALSRGPVVLDGGLGTHLEARGNELSSHLWSARLLAEDPAEIRAAHTDFYRAGARIAITASYQVSADGLAAAGIDDVDGLLRRSVGLAREARDEAGLSSEEAWVAASVGPYGASRADGSEYTGDYDLGVSQLRAWHRPRLRALAAAGPDLFAVETLPSLSEVEAVCAEIEDLGIGAWVSMTIAGGRLPTGESLADAAAIASSTGGVLAVGVNCCAVADVSGALAELRSVTALPLVAYPNSGEQWDATTRSWSGDGEPAHAACDEWIVGGARLVGGCCRVGPDEIARIARALAQR